MTFHLKKIKSFTLIDVLSGMVITSIIIGMVFYLFIIINQQIINYSKSRVQLNAFLLLNTDLKRQFFDQNNEIFQIPNGIQIKNENGIVEYKKDEELLIRSTPISQDTLTNGLIDMQLIQKKNFFIEKSNIINSYNLKIQVLGQEMDCHYKRLEDNASKINEILTHEF